MSEYTLPLETTRALWAYHKARHQIEDCKVPDNARIRFRNGSELGDMVLSLERLQDWHRKLGKERLEITVTETGIELRCNLSRNVTSELVLHRQEIGSLELDEVLELEAPHRGGDFEFKTELCVDKLVADVAQKKQTEKARKHLTNVIYEARTSRARIKAAAQEYRQASAYLFRKTLAQAVADARRKRKVLTFLRRSTDNLKQSPLWMSASGLWDWSMERRSLHITERALAQYKPRMTRKRRGYSLGRPEPVYGPKYRKLEEAVEDAKRRVRAVLVRESTAQLKAMGIHGYGWGYAQARPYSKNRKIVRAWPKMKSALVEEWRSALEEYRKANQNLNNL